MTNTFQRWLGHEITVDGIRWRVEEISDPDEHGYSTVRYERVYDKVREDRPIPRDPDPIRTIH